jgi:hypothetical protein
MLQNSLLNETAKADIRRAIPYLHERSRPAPVASQPGTLHRRRSSSAAKPEKAPTARLLSVPSPADARVVANSAAAAADLPAAPHVPPKRTREQESTTPAKRRKLSNSIKGKTLATATPESHPQILARLAGAAAKFAATFPADSKLAPVASTLTSMAWA